MLRNRPSCLVVSCVVTIQWRRHPESNREYKVLQTFALPFGHAAYVSPL